MNRLVHFGVILHHIATVAGWAFCLVLLGQPQERSMLGFVLLLALTFVQSIAVLALAARLLLGRLDEKEEKLQRSADRWCAAFGESKAKRLFGAMLAAMVVFKLVLPAGINRI